MNNEDNAQKLFIPEKVRVGFQNRSGTYTGQLAYVIYYDKAGVLRKEKSWEGWRDKKIDPQDFPNTPTEGFVLNKKVGGYKSHWNFRDAHVRVYDPRGFEFEISVPNLLFILREGDCSRGKGLEGKFVYAWDGTELVLLPTHSEDFKRSSSFTDLQGKSVKAKELIPGATYWTKRQEELVYLGKFDYHFQVETKQSTSYPSGDYYRRSPQTVDVPPSAKDAPGCWKRHVFWTGSDFRFLDDLKSIATLKDETTHPEFAHLVDKYQQSPNGSKVVRLFLKEEESDAWFVEENGGFTEYTTERDWHSKQLVGIQRKARIALEDGKLLHKQQYGRAYAPGQARRYGDDATVPYIDPTNLVLYAETANGAVHRVVTMDRSYPTYPFQRS